MEPHIPGSYTWDEDGAWESCLSVVFGREGVVLVYVWSWVISLPHQIVHLPHRILVLVGGWVCLDVCVWVCVGVCLWFMYVGVDWHARHGRKKKKAAPQSTSLRGHEREEQRSALRANTLPRKVKQ